MIGVLGRNDLLLVKNETRDHLVGRRQTGVETCVVLETEVAAENVESFFQWSYGMLWIHGRSR